MSNKRATTVGILTAGIAASILATTVGTASAQGNPVDGKGSVYFVSGALNTTGVAQAVYAFGNSDDEVYYGDWYGDGEDLPMVRRGNAFLVPDEVNHNVTATTFAYGNPGDTILVGDWDGDGMDTLAVRRGNHYLVKNDNTKTGKADADFYYGDAGDTVLVGNWNGVTNDEPTDGVDNSVPKNGTYDDPGTPAYPGDIAPVDDKGYDANGNGDYTEPGDRLPGTGVDNNKDGDYTDPKTTAIPADVPPGPAKGDTLMIQRGNKFFVKNSLTTGNADYTFNFGDAGDKILVGDWATAPQAETKDDSAVEAASGDGADQLAVQRGNEFFKSSELAAAHTAKKNPTTIESLYYGNPGDNVFVAKLASPDVDALGRPVPASDPITGDGFGVRR